MSVLIACGFAGLCDCYRPVCLCWHMWRMQTLALIRRRTTFALASQRHRFRTLMDYPDTPANELERLFALHRTHLLDTPPDARFDNITARARDYFDVQTVLVSLVDEDRQWFLSRQGLEAKETPREISFCGHAILGEDLLLIADALKDKRFRDNPLVTADPRIRFYAGQPIRASDGHKIGTLCLIDPEPRTLSSGERETLVSLAAEVETLISQRQPA